MKSITRQEWYGALVAVLVLGLLLSFASPYFLTTGNLSNILVQASVIALLAGGQTFVILTGGVDLAVGALTALAGAVAGHLMIKLGVDPYAAILAAFCSHAWRAASLCHRPCMHTLTSTHPHVAGERGG